MQYFDYQNLQLISGRAIINPDDHSPTTDVLSGSNVPVADRLAATEMRILDLESLLSKTSLMSDDSKILTPHKLDGQT